MEEQTELIDELIEKGHNYGQTTLKLIKLKTLDKTSDVLSNIVSWLPAIIMGSVFFAILNIGIALWLGDLIGDRASGFFVVAAFYALVTLICWIFRKPLFKYPIDNSIINQVFNEEDDQ
ncbi:hypothetical protein [Mangrovibacterium marinum]|uniref:Uncharacterized protein n=1 Tax=Mangrovibacterium marinum TaxID=1639118 RepID=A0A2T5C334_9BACT|nr:hypothetical protein [Mangrovibacterium marinum]PTN09118.1 hypothetical protein C8N47_106220 [Mangrovibacterium marinum]